MKTATRRVIEWVQENLDSMRVKLMNIADEAYFDLTSSKTYDSAVARIDEIDDLLRKIEEGRISAKDWERAKCIASERDAIRVLYKKERSL